MNIQRIVSALENRFFRYINERRGWKTDRKIVVIESDDWGSIRMPNREVYNAALAQGIAVDKCHYCKYDTLAAEDDLTAMFDVLRKHKDSQGKHPVITANTIVANPDFEKIKKDGFQQYHYELFTDTLKRYPKRSFKLWEEGANEKIFHPQLHGREHLNVGRWLTALQNGSKEQLFAFEHQFFGISKTISNENNPSFMAALDYDDQESRLFGNESIADACEIFEDIFGFKSASFIGPNYFWHEDTEAILADKGVIYLQGGFNQKLPSSTRRHYLGKLNSFNQRYLVRNVEFEPAGKPSEGLVQSALKQIEHAFNLNKPAIISTHRVAFIGSIFEENRAVNLKLFDELLTQIIKLWPNVEFMSSDQLGGLISGSNQ